MLVIRAHTCAGDEEGKIAQYYQEEVEGGTLPTQREADLWIKRNIGEGNISISVCVEVEENLIFHAQSQESLEQYIDDMRPVEGRSVRLFRAPKSKCPICLGEKARRRTLCGHTFCPPCILDAIRWSVKCPVCQFQLVA